MVRRNSSEIPLLHFVLTLSSSLWTSALGNIISSVEPVIVWFLCYDKTLTNTILSRIELYFYIIEREDKVRTKTEALRGMPHNGLLSWFAQHALLYSSGPPAQEGQSDRGIFSVKVLSSLMTLAYVELTKKNNQHKTLNHRGRWESPFQTH